MNSRAIDKLRGRLSDTVRGGADYADLYLQCSSGHSILFEDGHIEQLSSSCTDGCGARVILGDRTYFAHAPGTTSDKAADMIGKAESFAFTYPRPNASFAAGELFNEKIVIAAPDISFLHDIDKDIRSRSSFVKQAVFRYSVSNKQIMILGSDGRTAAESRNYCSFSAYVIAEKRGMLQTGYERCCMALPPGCFWQSSSPQKVASFAFDRAMLMLDAKPCPAGRMRVLMAGEAGGTIVHEACGHGLEADILEKDCSVYKGKLGEKVAADNVTMVDDPTIPGLFGSYNYDDEGQKSERTVLIENGVLKGYLTDLLSAKSYSLPYTGNGRRESYSCIPIPRMSNTFILPGKSEYEEMIDMAGNGLLVKKMGGGEVNPTTGDFVFYVSEAYVIKSGKAAYPVRGATLTGNGPDSINKITAIGKDLYMDPGMCGKSGQNVPVTDGQPSVLIESMTVGGNEA